MKLELPGAVIIQDAKYQKGFNVSREKTGYGLRVEG